jgi:hypothetical protein
MIVTKVVSTVYKCELESGELVPGVKYRATVKGVGRTWDGGKASGDYRENFSVDQSLNFTKPADNFSEIIERLHYETGDFQSFDYTEVVIVWEIGREKYTAIFNWDEPEAIPEDIRHYFYTGTEERLWEFYALGIY